VAGTHITDQQVRLYMSERKEGRTQAVAAAKAGVSVRSARRIDTGEIATGPAPQRHWRTRQDPLAGVWDTELVPLLKANPELLPTTLLEFLCDYYPGQYDDKILRTLQRRVKAWKAKHGPDKEVMFRQIKVPGRLGLSDFTVLKGVTITILGQVFQHLLYHYRLAFSGWRYAKVVCGGESFAALSTGLQAALWRSGGVPLEHRTDSLSAAFNNLAEKEQLTARYGELCRHYGLKATRNNPGVSHENGAIESPHGPLKRRIEQALLLRGSYDFASLEDYQLFVDGIVSKLNRRCQTRFEQERPHLQALPKRRTQDYAEHRVLISSSSSFDLKRVTYTVPSRFIGERLYVQLYDERLELFHGHERVLELPRVYSTDGQRGRCVDYRHVIGSLIKKPQAFRYSQLRDDLLPSPDYHRIWRYVDDELAPHKACRYIVRLLHLAASQHCEAALGRYVLRHIEQGELPSELQCRQRFTSAEATVIPLMTGKQHSLGDYDQLLEPSREVQYV
jgi:transposase InsO family protein